MPSLFTTEPSVVVLGRDQRPQEPRGTMVQIPQLVGDNARGLHVAILVRDSAIRIVALSSRVSSAFGSKISTFFNKMRRQEAYPQYSRRVRADCAPE
jgi:hypothetical protein